MSYKDVQDSQHRFTTAKPDHRVKAGTPKFIEGLAANGKIEEKPVELYYMPSPTGKGYELAETKERGFAMLVQYESGVKKYYIKFATTGSSVGSLLDPWGMYSNPGDENKYETKLGRYKYEYQEVNRFTFDSYLNFLNTRNARYLREAQREARNAQ